MDETEYMYIHSLINESYELQVVVFLSQKKTKDDINVLDPNSDVCKLILHHNAMESFLK